MGMTKLYRHQLLLLAISISLPTVASQPADCAKIAAPAERLACFDGYFPDKVQPVAPSSATVEAPQTPPPVTPVGRRLHLEAAQRGNPFAITAHRPNYFLPAAHNRSADYRQFGDAAVRAFADTEVKFQLSLKVTLAENLWRNSSIAGAYTQVSYWQLYADQEASAPFRESNHEPEFIWSVPLQFSLLGLDAKLASLKLNHQSNGRSGRFSRSWNRVIGQLILERGNFAMSFDAWKRLDGSDDDDNPEIENFMGRFDIGLAYQYGQQNFVLGYKNGWGHDKRGGAEFNWTFPITKHLRGMVQIYSGYGENLIDMENYSNRIGFGIAVSDWL